MIDFPNNPSVGQIFGSVTGPVYIWDGVAWNLVGADTFVGPDFVQGLTLVPNGTTSIDVNPGSAAKGGLLTTAPALMTKNLAANWAAGSGGGLDTGAKAASKTYFVHEIIRTADKIADTLISLSPTAPALPSGWSLVQRLAAIKTDASGNIVPFTQSANRMSVQSLTEMTTGAGSAVALRTLATVPLGIVTRARLANAINAAASSTVQLFVYGATKNTAWGYDLYNYATTVSGVAFNYGQIYGDVETNTASQVQVGVGIPSGSGTASLVCYGWDDFTVPRIGA